MDKINGKFIVIEGPEGSGKSSVASYLFQYLKSKNVPIFKSREPGGGVISEAIRSIIVKNEYTDMDMGTEFLLFSAQRRQNIVSDYNRALSEGKILLLDRYEGSTFAYQGYGRGLSLDDMKFINRFATGGLTPDLTILLDISVKLGLARKAATGDWNRLDAESVDFHSRIREGFLQIARENLSWQVVDASPPLEIVQNNVLEIVNNELFQGKLLEFEKNGRERKG